MEYRRHQGCVRPCCERVHEQQNSWPSAREASHGAPVSTSAGAMWVAPSAHLSQSLGHERQNDKRSRNAPLLWRLLPSQQRGPSVAATGSLDDGSCRVPVHQLCSRLLSPPPRRPPSARRAGAAARRGRAHILIAVCEGGITGRARSREAGAERTARVQATPLRAHEGLARCQRRRSINPYGLPNAPGNLVSTYLNGKERSHEGLVAGEEPRACCRFPPAHTPAALPPPASAVSLTPPPRPPQPPHISAEGGRDSSSSSSVALGPLTQAKEELAAARRR